MKIVVIGGTGLIGSRLVDRLDEDGHTAIPASPRLGINTITGEGLSAALDGAAVVVDVSNSPSFEYAAALEFFETSTRNLLAAEQAAGVEHHVVLSVVGTRDLAELGDPSTSTAGYFRAKLSQESLIARSPIPYSVVHATQFFEFIEGIADAATIAGEVRLPPVRFRPMAADDVAAAVAGVAEASPLMGTVDIAGPEEFRFDELVRHVLAAWGDPRPVVTDPAAGYFGIAVRDRTLVPLGAARLGGIGIDPWLRLMAAANTVGVG